MTLLRMTLHLPQRTLRITTTPRIPVTSRSPPRQLPLQPERQAVALVSRHYTPYPRNQPLALPGSCPYSRSGRRPPWSVATTLWTWRSASTGGCSSTAAGPSDCPGCATRPATRPSSSPSPRYAHKAGCTPGGERHGARTYTGIGIQRDKHGRHHSCSPNAISIGSRGTLRP